MCKICEKLGLTDDCSDDFDAALYHAENGLTCVPGVMKGWTVSEETRRLISESRKGTPAWNKGLSGEKMPMFGKTHSEETRAKMRASWRPKSKWNTGKPHTEEAKQKIREKRAQQVITEEHKASLRAASAAGWEKRRLKYGANGRAE